MKTGILNKFSIVYITMIFLMFGATTIQAQEPGTPGVDPNAVMLDDFESGDFSTKWAPRPGARGEIATLEMVDAAKGGSVKFGKYALRLNVDFSGAQAGQTLVAQISPKTLTIPGNDGKSGGKVLGMWAYATPGIDGMWFRVSTRPNGATSGTTNTDLASKIDWTGWKYVKLNLPANHEFHPDGIRLLVLKSYANYYAKGYLIVDNIRVTNQSFVEDLVPPVVNMPKGNGETLSGATFTTSTVEITATYNDNATPSSGVNYNSICVSIDGTVYKEGDAGFSIDKENNSVKLSGVTLSNGAHTAIVQVEDNFGHITAKPATFTIDAVGRTTTVELTESAQAEVGKPFEMKINTNNAKDIKALDMVIEINQFGKIDATNGVTFAPSAAGSTFSYNPVNGYLTINLKNSDTTDESKTLATINADISKNSNPDDILRVNPVTAKATYADDTSSGFTLFTAFTRNVKAAYKYTIIKRVVGQAGEVKVTDLNNNPVSGATVYALNQAMTDVLATAETDANGLASNMNFTNIAQAVNIYAGKDGSYSYTNLVRTLNPLLTKAPTYIHSGITADPKTSKTITWYQNPVTSEEPAIMKLAKKADGESNFVEHKGISATREYNAVLNSGIAKGGSVTVNNLEPGTTYIYQVGDGVNWSATQEFTTTSATKNFTFSAYGDLQASSVAEMSRFINAAKTLEALPQKPFFSLNVGDIVDSDDNFGYLSFYGEMYNQRPGFAGIDVMAAYGNHEYMGNPDADNIKFFNGHHTVAPSTKYDAKIVGTGTYAVEYENMIVIGLDWAHKGGATPAEIMTEQAKWMDEVLSKTTKEWKIVTLHYPMYPSESTPGAQGIYCPIFDKYGVQVVFCGHGHTFERFQVKNNQYLMPPSNKRTFTPVIGGSLHFQLGDMTGTGSNGRWIQCNVKGKEMKFIVRDATNNIVENECFTLYASELGEFDVNFNATGKGTIEAKVDNATINTGDKVKECKDVVFTATPEVGYKIKGWKNNGVAVNGTESSYTISGIDAASTVTVEFESTQGVDTGVSPNLNIYPNPFANTVNITGAETCSLRVIDISGSLVHTQEITHADETINLEKLAAGIYFFQIEKDNQTKIVKAIKR